MHTQSTWSVASYAASRLTRATVCGIWFHLGCPGGILVHLGSSWRILGAFLGSTCGVLSVLEAHGRRFRLKENLPYIPREIDVKTPQIHPKTLLNPPKIEPQTAHFGVILGVGAAPGRLLAPRRVLDCFWANVWVALGRFLGRPGRLLGASSGALGASGRPRTPTRGPERHPRGTQEAPKRPPRGLQEGSKSLLTPRKRTS